MQFAHFGKSGRKEEAFALSLFPGMNNWIKKIIFLEFLFFFFFLLFIDIYLLFYIYYSIINKIELSKRPFRDSNCRYAFRLATTQRGGGVSAVGSALLLTDFIPIPWKQPKVDAFLLPSPSDGFHTLPFVDVTSLLSPPLF